MVMHLSCSYYAFFITFINYYIKFIKVETAMNDIYIIRKHSAYQNIFFEIHQLNVKKLKGVSDKTHTLKHILYIFTMLYINIYQLPTVFNYSYKKNWIMLPSTFILCKLWNLIGCPYCSVAGAEFHPHKD